MRRRCRFQRCSPKQWHGERFHYDMPYTLSARDFYDVIHTSPIESSRNVLHEHRG